MTEIDDLLQLSNPRLHVLHPGAVGYGPVLLWVQRAQRAGGNLAANLAIDIANQLRQSVVAVFCLADYPHATLRAYHFMAEGLAELPDGFAKRGIGWVLRAGQPEAVIPALARELGASVVVTDLAPTKPERRWKEAVGKRLDVPLLGVDGDVVIPTAHFPDLEWAPRTMRPKVARLLSRYLEPIPDSGAHHRSDMHESPDPFDLIETLSIDRSVAPSPTLHGGQARARKRLEGFVEGPLARYHLDRSKADIDGSSRMTPYLHYGQISPLEIAVAVKEADAPKDAVDAFLDELIVNRELTINFALRCDGYDSYDGLPDWGKKTLAKHADDERGVKYGITRLEAGKTHDRLWNAAQRQMVHEGYLPNRLRMYWAKQIALWASSPDRAFEMAVELNDRYFVDGRDASGYAGIAWAIGGRHDRPFPPEKAVIGLVRPMGMNAMKKSFDVDRYITDIEERYGEP